MRRRRLRDISINGQRFRSWREYWIAYYEDLLWHSWLPAGSFSSWKRGTWA